MAESKQYTFFLGANSARGFYSLYDGFVSPARGDFLWVIKGGPGCGKSTFMKLVGKAAQEQGLETEYIRCSGDPDSLDAVYIPALRTGYADGTAPHVLDPLYPAAAGLYLDLGAFYDPAALEGRLEDIIALNAACKACYTRAYSSLAAAGSLALTAYAELVGEAQQQQTLRRAESAGQNELRQSGHGEGRVKKRFLGAFTCKGEVFYPETVAALCSRVYTLDNEYGLADLYLRRILAVAETRQYDVVLCPDWLCPEKLQAVLIPELSLGFVALRPGVEGLEETRHIRLDAAVSATARRQLRPELRSAKKLAAALREDARICLHRAKSLHDELEAIYNPHVDFDGLRGVARTHAAWIAEQATA